MKERSIWDVKNADSELREGIEEGKKGRFLWGAKDEGNISKNGSELNEGMDEGKKGRFLWDAENEDKEMKENMQDNGTRFGEKSEKKRCLRIKMNKPKEVLSGNYRQVMMDTKGQGSMHEDRFADEDIELGESLQLIKAALDQDNMEKKVARTWNGRGNTPMNKTPSEQVMKSEERLAKRRQQMWKDESKINELLKKVRKQ